LRTGLPLRVLAGLFAALGVFPLANAISNGPAVQWWNVAVREWVVRGPIAVLVALLLASMLGYRVDDAFDRAKGLLLRIPSRTFGSAIAVAAFATAAFLALYCFAGAPFTSDEMAQQWHARILLGGHVAATAEPLREFFNTAPVYDRDGRWFSQYPIGGPALIAAGLWLRGAWLVNPILLAVATWHLYRFLALAFGELCARVTTLLFVASPMVLIMAASQMNHVATLAFVSIALAALARWDATDDAREQRRYALIVGLALGAAALVRPLDAALVGLVVGSFQLWRAWGAPARWRSVGIQVLAGAIPIGLLLWTNARTTGSPLLFGYEALNGPEHGLGFHVDPNGVAHTPRRGLAYASGYMMRLSRYTFEWPIPGTLVVVAGMLSIRRPTRWDALLAALAAIFLVGYGAYWFDGFFSGPRFLFTAVPAFIYFTARAPGSIAGMLRRPLLRRAMLLLVPLCELATWTVGGVSSSRDRIASYRDQRTKLKTDVEAQIARAGLHDALVFVNEPWRGRLLARLRVLGLSQFRAERALNTVDACALQSALDAEDTLMARSDGERAGRVLSRARAFGAARLESGLQADQTIALVPGSRPTPTCLGEFQRDTIGTIPYPIFLMRQRVGSDGRIGGEVVFARDLGPRDTLLRERFGTRSWYRYRPPASLDDTAAVFIPYRAR
jgi:hypothetical protein